MRNNRSATSKKLLGLSLCMTAALSSSGWVSAQNPPSTLAQHRPAIAPLPIVKTLRVYVLDCGQLIYNHPESYNLTREEVVDTNMPVTCYLVMHPKGVLLFDTGLSDQLIGRPVYENAIDGYGQIVTKTLLSQLADIGVAPSDINYLALSHSHFDHVGNISEFPNATWLTSNAEQDFMFTAQATPENAASFASLKHNPQQLFKGDHDVFGDDSVILKQTPGHTPGHQSLYVKLKQYGGVLISGDLYHYPEERTKNRMPDKEKHVGTPESRQAMEDFLKQTHSQLWIGHSTEFVRNALKSPAWYD